MDSFLFYKQFKLFYFKSISFLKSESKKKSTESVSAD
ncbi:aspartate kinase [Streptococcus mitis]|uniref:Aspartate kinase n=1 Tax=Streptococcus mitis TaxID=28037 RepID=A0A7X1V499_STRMT|nr:aspartate kinase [Streptococcus mitis]MQQ50756.1 aspartate kinase [Streptococcus mitis]